MNEQARARVRELYRKLNARKGKIGYEDNAKGIEKAIAALEGR